MRNDETKRNLLASGNPIPPNWDLLKGVELGSGERWTTEESVTSRYDGIQKYLRYVKYFAYPASLILRRGKFEKILTKDQFHGLMFAEYARILRLRKPPRTYAATFIYKPKKGLVGKVYERFVRNALSSPALRKVFVFGKEETREYERTFPEGAGKFVSETLGIKDVAERFRKEETDSNLFVACGRSNRDYGFLKDVWDGKRRLVVVCDVDAGELPDGAELLRNCKGDDFLELLSMATASLIPLDDERISSGQLVALQSAMLGIPVIATRNSAISEYVEDGKTGYVVEKTPEAFEKALSLVENPKIRTELSRNARRTFEERFSLLEMGRRIGAKIAEDSGS